MRLLILCTANSARSQMAEGWARHLARIHGLDLEVHSAGTRATRVNPHAIEAMADVGIDLTGHTSKTLFDVPSPWAFDLVLTVCDTAHGACPPTPPAPHDCTTPFPTRPARETSAAPSGRRATRSARSSSG